MKRRGTIGLRVFVGISLAAIFSAVVFDDEPRHNGRGVSSWFREYAVRTSEESPASGALRAMGPKAVPFLIRTLKKKDSNLRRAYINFWPSLPLAMQKLLPEPKETVWDRRAALCGLAILGPQAEKAIPSIIQTLNDGEKHVEADAAYTLMKMGPKATNAVPALNRYLQKNRDPYNGLAAAIALWRIAPRQTGIVVPALMDMLKENDLFSFDANVLRALAEIGPPAKEAIPFLRTALEASDEEEKTSIDDALKRIELESSIDVSTK